MWTAVCLVVGTWTCFNDLANARKCGLMTAFFARPKEYGPNQKRDFAAEQDWDVVATDIEDLASKLGV